MNVGMNGQVLLFYPIVWTDSKPVQDKDAHNPHFQIVTLELYVSPIKTRRQLQNAPEKKARNNRTNSGDISSAANMPG